MKAVFTYAHENKFDWTYVTVFEKHEWLVTLLQEFGFDIAPDRTKQGERVMRKPAHRTTTTPTMTALEYAIRFGPCKWSWDCANVWLVPSQPRYDQILFPDRQEQVALFHGMEPYGNAIRKAYLCRANLRGVQPGDVLAFYRSTSSRSIRTLGVVENWIASTDPEKIQQFVARRTVYAMQEIRSMAEGREVLAIRFRQVLHTFPEIPYDDLERAGVLAAAPQSIVRARPEGLQWLRERLALSP